MRLKPDFNLDEFIRTNAPYLTMADMAYEVGCTSATIGLACEKLGIKAVTKGEQTKNMVREMANKMTVEEFAGKFGFSAAGIKTICREMGIEMLAGAKQKSGPKPKEAPPEMKLPAKPRKTVAQRLATVRRDIGYGHDRTDPDLELYNFIFNRDE